MVSPRTRRRFGILVVTLAFFGFALSVARAYGVIESHLSSDGAVPELARLDRAATSILSTLIGARQDTPFYERLELEIRRFYGKFNQHPVVTLLHVVPAALMMLLAPLQFSARIRRTNITWHRWSGRVLVAVAIPVAISGLFFGLFMPFAGTLEASAIAVVGTWFLYVVIRGFSAIRAGDIDRHRTWMTRMFAVAIGVVVVRIVGFPLALVTREPPSAWFGQSVWIGFGLSVLLGELWIRRTRDSAS